MITVHPSDIRSDLLVHLLSDIKTAANIHLRLVRQSHYKCGKFQSESLLLRSRINYFAYMYVCIERTLS